MFVPAASQDWPRPGSTPDLRISLNAPLLADGARSSPTRAALGWWPDPEAGSVLRLWLRNEADADPPVAVYEHPVRPAGPAGRAELVEHAERFLATLGFLFEPATGEAAGEIPSVAEADPTAAPAGRTGAVRQDVPLTRLRGRGEPGRAPGPPPDAADPTSDPALAAWLRALLDRDSQEGRRP